MSAPTAPDYEFTLQACYHGNMSAHAPKITWHRHRDEDTESTDYLATIDGVEFTIIRGDDMTYWHYWIVGASVGGRSVRLREHFRGANRSLTSLRDAKSWAASHAAEIRQLAAVSA